MTGLLVTYEIDKSSAGVVVTRVADVRPISFCGNGSYAFPTSLVNSYFLRQLGLVPKADRALIYLQPPGVYTPNFGYGPITGSVKIREEPKELPGDYVKFKTMERQKTVLTREVIQDDVKFVDKKTYDAVASGSDRALEKVFEELKFGTRLHCTAL